MAHAISLQEAPRLAQRVKMSWQWPRIALEFSTRNHSSSIWRSVAIRNRSKVFSNQLFNRNSQAVILILIRVRSITVRLQEIHATPLQVTIIPWILLASRNSAKQYFRTAPRVLKVTASLQRQISKTMRWEQRLISKSVKEAFSPVSEQL